MREKREKRNGNLFGILIVEPSRHDALDWNSVPDPKLVAQLQSSTYETPWGTPNLN
jgi:hypothetical protein